MLTVISPAKTLDFESKPATHASPSRSSWTIPRN